MGDDVKFKIIMLGNLDVGKTCASSLPRPRLAARVVPVSSEGLSLTCAAAL